MKEIPLRSETENEKVDLFEDVTIPCKTARELLDNLDLTHPRWSRQNWIFRGQNDARWELMPSLFRKWKQGTNPGLELALIRLFISNANLAQLPIPNNSLGYYTNTLKPTVRQLTAGASYDFSHVVFAIAQHSGVPTRLLDFSHSPLIAAYFAIEFANLYESLGLANNRLAQYFRSCADCFTDGDDVEATIAELVEAVKLSMDNLPDEVVVWAVQAQDLGDYTSIKLLEHPFMEILPLRMQKALFLCDTEFAEEEVQQGQNGRLWMRNWRLSLRQMGSTSLRCHMWRLKRFTTCLPCTGFHGQSLRPRMRRLRNRPLHLHMRSLDKTEKHLSNRGAFSRFRLEVRDEVSMI